VYRPAQREIRDAGLVSKACERFGFERLHPSSPGLRGTLLPKSV
jgi:hypothetical protein